MAKRKRSSTKSTKKAPSTPKPTSNDQVVMMTSLSQPAAGWLAGLESRALRDIATIPRDSHGRYDARDIVRFVAGQFPEAQLSEAQLESVNAIADVILSEGRFVTGVIHILETIQTKYGNQGLAAVAKQLLIQLRDDVANNPDDYLVLTPEEEEKRLRDEVTCLIETRRKDATNHQARSLLQKAVICDYCGLRRHANKWIDSPPPKDHIVEYGTCPACEKLPYDDRPSFRSKAAPVREETPLADELLLLDGQPPGKA